MLIIAVRTLQHDAKKFYFILEDLVVACRFPFIYWNFMTLWMVNFRGLERTSSTVIFKYPILERRFFLCTDVSDGFPLLLLWLRFFFKRQNEKMENRGKVFYTLAHILTSKQFIWNVSCELGVNNSFFLNLCLHNRSFIVWSFTAIAFNRTDTCRADKHLSAVIKQF